MLQPVEVEGGADGSNRRVENSAAEACEGISEAAPRVRFDVIEPLRLAARAAGLTDDAPAR